MTVSRYVSAVLIAAVVLSIGVEPVLAQTSDGGVLDGVGTRFETVVTPMVDTVKIYAERLFFAIVVVDLFWTMFKLVFRGATLNDYTGQIMRRIIIYGIFIWLIRESAFATQILNSFSQLANIALADRGLTNNVTPSSLIGFGLDLASDIAGTVKALSPVAGFGIIIASLLVLVTFALIAAQLLQVLVETYVAVLVGIIMLGFGATQTTQDYARKFMFYLIGVGLKLFTITIVAGVGYLAIKDFTGGDYYKSFGGTLTILAMSMVLFALVKSIPEIVQGVVNGVGSSSSAGMFGVAAATAGAAVAGASAVGTGGASAGAQGVAGAAGAGGQVAGGAAKTGGLGQALRFGASYSTGAFIPKAAYKGADRAVTAGLGKASQALKKSRGGR